MNNLVCYNSVINWCIHWMMYLRCCLVAPPATLMLWKQLPSGNEKGINYCAFCLVQLWQLTTGKQLLDASAIDYCHWIRHDRFIEGPDLFPWHVFAWYAKQTKTNVLMTPWSGHAKKEPTQTSPNIRKRDMRQRGSEFPRMPTLHPTSWLLRAWSCVVGMDVFCCHC